MMEDEISWLINYHFNNSRTSRGGVEASRGSTVHSMVGSCQKLNPTLWVPSVIVDRKVGPNCIVNESLGINHGCSLLPSLSILFTSLENFLRNLDKFLLALTAILLVAQLSP